VPRKSLAEKLYTDEDGCRDPGRWLIVYDFAGKTNSNFWTNLRRLSSLDGESRLLQLSIYLAEGRRSARVALSLARHY
jgi:hypothetical protein